MSARMERVIRRRMVLEIWHGGADARTMRSAAQFASMLGLELHGLFIEDTSMLALADLQFVREIRLPTCEWQTITAERMQVELRHTAAEARRVLNDIASAVGVHNAFEILRGDPGDMMATTLSADDVVVLAALTDTSRRLAPGPASVYDAVDRSAASVLLLPAGFTPREGCVVALVGDAGDPSLTPAARIAVRAREELLLLVPRDRPPVASDAEARAVALGMARSHVTTRRISALLAEDVVHALGHTRDRLIVVTRNACPAGGIAEASRVANHRGVPVLLVAPDGAALS